MKVLTYADKVLERLIATQTSPLQARLLILLTEEPGQSATVLCKKVGCCQSVINRSPNITSEKRGKYDLYRLNDKGEALVQQLFSKS